VREAPPVALLDANALWSADEFLTRLWLTNTAEVLTVLREQAGHRINPPRTVFDIRTTLERSIPHFVGAVRESGLVGSGTDI